MGEHWCHCDPHGDNARCDRPCCKPRQFGPPRPSHDDMAEAIEALRLLAYRTKSEEVSGRLARVAAWIEQQAHK